MKRLCSLFLVCGLLLTAFVMPAAAYADEYDYEYDSAYNDTYEYEDDYDDETMPLGTKIAIAVGAGLVIGLITVLVLRSQLHSVRMQYGAASYIRPDSMKVEVASDMFLYRHVTKVALPKNDKD